MSAIVGLVDRTGGPLEPADIERMHDRLAHRGPDGGDCWRDDRIGLGHQLLATTPEATYDEQPYRDGDLVITAAVRLDNRDELLDQLPVSKPPPRIPDSELLLAAYRQWATQCLDRLVGVFAFAIWDARTEQLFCARDHVGIKPFYYHQTTEAFAFGTELKAILELPTVPGTVDERRIGDFLTGGLEDERTSYYEAISRLPPAHAMTVSADGIEQWQYWDLDPTRTITLESDAAYERRFRELFEQAVQCRLRSAGPVGSELSGGIDSSSITVVARDLLPEDEPLYTFSNVFDDAPSSDEREFIETLIDRDGIDSHYIFQDECGVLVDPERFRDQFDKPPHNTLHFAGWQLAKRADETGVDAVLSGALGDSAINYGLGLLPQLFRTGRWRHLNRELRAMSEVVDAPVREMFVRHVLAPFVPDPVSRYRRQLRDRPVLEAAANPTLNPDFVDRIDLRDRYRTYSSPGSVLTETTDRKRQYHSLTSGRNTANFEANDLLNGSFGFEPRYPFADKRLLEFSLAIPPTQQFADGWTRSIVRRSLDDLLPETIQWRPWKTMLNEGFWNALEREDERLQTLLAEPGPLIRYLDIDDLCAAYDRFEADPSSRDARTLWRALALSEWLADDPTRSIHSHSKQQHDAKY